jgi:hemolysin III
LSAEALPDKPRLRGVIHQWSFFVALAGGLVLVATAPTTRATWGALIYALSLATLLGVSATYHRVSWQPGPRLWMRRLDHSAIFVLIAGTYTPLCLALPDGGALALAMIWGLAALGTLKSVLWPLAPKALVAALCVAMGWGGVLLVPTIQARSGAWGLAAVLAGGVLYSVGAVIYAAKRPNPVPGVFGYHEVFHALVVAAAALHFGVMTQVVQSL